MDAMAKMTAATTKKQKSIMMLFVIFLLLAAYPSKASSQALTDLDLPCLS
jgi:hypothetical protein